MPSTEIFRLKSTLATMAVVAGAVAVFSPGGSKRRRECAGLQ